MCPVVHFLIHLKKVMYTIVFVMFLVYLSFMKENKYFVQKEMFFYSK